MARLQPIERTPAAAETCSKCHRTEHLSALVDVAGRIAVIGMTVVLIGAACVSLLSGNEQHLLPISVLLATVNGASAFAAIEHMKRKGRTG